MEVVSWQMFKFCAVLTIKKIQGVVFLGGLLWFMALHMMSLN
jgi:hypothetical protein